MNTIQEFLEKKYKVDLGILETVHDIVSINELPKDKYTVDSNDKVHIQPMSDEEYEYHILSIYGKKDLSDTYNLLFINIYKGRLINEWEGNSYHFIQRALLQLLTSSTFYSIFQLHIHAPYSNIF